MMMMMMMMMMELTFFSYFCFQFFFHSQQKGVPNALWLQVSFVGFNEYVYEQEI